MLRCPTCGDKLEFARRPLQFRQRAILTAIEHLKRDKGRLPTAPTISTHIGVPLATVKMELHFLEQGDGAYVHRPNGMKSGWDVKTDEDIVLVSVRRAVAA